MSKTRPHEAAFSMAASIEYPNGFERVYEHGLTKREYFAVMAMQGILSKESFADRLVAQPDSHHTLRKRIARASLVMADLLIQELNEGGEQ